jgi:hypothetical protein
MFHKGDVVAAKRDVKDHSSATFFSPAKTVVLEGMVGVVVDTPGLFDLLDRRYAVRFDGGRTVRMSERDLEKSKVPALH